MGNLLRADPADEELCANYRNRHTLDMCLSLSILSEIVSTTEALAERCTDCRPVGIYTDDVLNSYKGKNRLEVGELYAIHLGLDADMPRCLRMCLLSLSPHIVT